MPTALTAEELTQLLGLEDASLGTVVAAGDSSAVKRILLFIPDLFLDAVDMVSIGKGVGLGGGGELFITHWASLGLRAEVGVAVLWYYNRNLAICPLTALNASFGPWTAYNHNFYGAGTGWSKGKPGAGGYSFKKAGMFSTDDRIVQEGWMDPWEIGGPGASLHPVEIADFFANLFTVGFFDLCKDDYASGPERADYTIGLPVE